MKENKLPYLLPIRSIMFLFVFVAGSLITRKGLDEISNWWTIVATVVNIITIALLVLAAKKNGMNYLELIGYKKGSTKISQILIMSVIVLVVGTGGMYLAGFLCYGVVPYSSPMMIAPIPMVLAIINFLPLPITTALAEDGLYLGCGVNHIENKMLAIIVPAFFYALQHCFIPTLFDAKYILYRIFSFLPLTIILCWYYYKKRNPVPIMIGHALIDMMTVSWVLATSINPGFYEIMVNM